MEEADIIHGKISGALLSNAAIGVMSDVHDFDLARLQMDGYEDRHEVDRSLIDDQDLGKVDRSGGRGVMNDGSFIICHPFSFWGGWNAMATQDGGDRRFDDRDPELAHFTDDPLGTPGITSPIILESKPNNLLFGIQACTLATTSTLRLVMLLDQQSIPTTYRAQRGSDSDLEQMLPSDVVTEPGQQATVIICEGPDGRGTMKTEQIPFQQEVSELSAGAFQMLRGDVSDVQGLRGHGTEAWGAVGTASGEFFSSYQATTSDDSTRRKSENSWRSAGESFTFQSSTTTIRVEVFWQRMCSGDYTGTVKGGP